MATKVRWKWFLIPILGFALLAGGVVVQVQGGKPAPPPPPPVLYNIQFWTVPQIGQLINEMNTYGQVVGKCWTSVDTGEAHGYLYDPLVNIDENTDGIAIATDLNTCAVSGIPEGFMIASANGINDHGIVVGYLLPNGSAYDNSVRKGYVLDTTVTPFVLEVLPDPEGSDYWYGARINNSGDILMLCRKDNGKFTAYIYTWGTDGRIIPLEAELTNTRVDLNNSAQVALQVDDGSTNGAACRWNALTGTLDPIGGKDTNVFGINDNDGGTVCGGTTAKPPKGSPANYPYRYTNSLQVLYGQTGSAYAINSDSDLLLRSPGIKSYVYQNALGAFYDVDSLIDPSDPNAPRWSSKSYGIPYLMNDRIGATRFGQLVGEIKFADGSHSNFLLTPKP